MENDDEFQTNVEEYAQAGAEIRRLGEQIAAKQAFWWAVRATDARIDERTITIMWSRYLAEQEKHSPGEHESRPVNASRPSHSSRW